MYALGREILAFAKETNLSNANATAASIKQQQATNMAELEEFQKKQFEVFEQRHNKKINEHRNAVEEHQRQMQQVREKHVEEIERAEEQLRKTLSGHATKIAEMEAAHKDHLRHCEAATLAVQKMHDDRVKAHEADIKMHAQKMTEKDKAYEQTLEDLSKSLSIIKNEEKEDIELSRSDNASSFEALQAAHRKDLAKHIADADKWQCKYNEQVAETRAQAKKNRDHLQQHYVGTDTALKNAERTRLADLAALEESHQAEVDQLLEKLDAVQRAAGEVLGGGKGLRQELEARNEEISNWKARYELSVKEHNEESRALRSTIREMEESLARAQQETEAACANATDDMRRKHAAEVHDIFCTRGDGSSNVAELRDMHRKDLDELQKAADQWREAYERAVQESRAQLRLQKATMDQAQQDAAAKLFEKDVRMREDRIVLTRKFKEQIGTLTS